jgi:hypothetical protein
MNCDCGSQMRRKVKKININDLTKECKSKEIKIDFGDTRVRLLKKLGRNDPLESIYIECVSCGRIKTVNRPKK